MTEIFTITPASSRPLRILVAIGLTEPEAFIAALRRAAPPLSD